ncbi:MAG: hypothetical protein WC045_03500 [Patescibacteria group bacterium]
MESKTRLHRLLEIVPGAVTWMVLCTPFILGLYTPRYLAYFVIFFDLYWLIKAMYMGGFLISSHIHMERDKRINWFDRCQALLDLPRAIEEKKAELATVGFLHKKKIREELSELVVLQDQEPNYLKRWDQIYHLVLLPHYKDEYQIIRSAVASCAHGNFPSQKMIIVIALEEREEGEAKFEKVKKIQEEFGDYFYDIFYTLHADAPNEIKGKSANIKWAGKVIQKYIDEKGIPYDDIMVSAFDGDTRVSSEYFGCLTYKYLITPERTKRTYQPIPLFNNNIWEVPFLVRLVSFGSSFWQMIESCRPYRLINFSSQAMSLRTLVDIDFWDEKIVSEDSRQYYRAFFRYHGNHQAIPLFTPVNMDAVLGNSLWQTFKYQYYQKRRWAWGVENFPYLVLESMAHPEIVFWKKFILVWRIFIGSVEWSTASLLIAFAGWLPILLNADFRDSVLAYNLPIIARNILMATWIGIFASTYISLKLVPPRPKNYPKAKAIEMIVQWIFVPITAIFFGSIPAIDAQTRMMLGGRFRLGFWVTPKKFVRPD